MLSLTETRFVVKILWSPRHLMFHVFTFDRDVITDIIVIRNIFIVALSHGIARPWLPCLHEMCFTGVNKVTRVHRPWTRVICTGL